MADRISGRPARTGNAGRARKAERAGRGRAAAGAAKPGRAGAGAPARKGAAPALLAGGNPQIAKGYGEAPVAAYIAAMPGWKREVGRRLDALIVQTVPGVVKAVKWNSPFYGAPEEEAGRRKGRREGQREGQTWFLSFRCFARYVKVAFFRGAELRPPPPGPSRHPHVRYLDMHEGEEFDERQLAAWVEQASRLPGVRM